MALKKGSTKSSAQSDCRYLIRPVEANIETFHDALFLRAVKGLKLLLNAFEFEVSQ
jgi:hypothetical protein